MTNIEDIFATLREMEIKLFLQGDDLKVVSYKNKISLEETALIKQNKEAIISFLKSTSGLNAIEPIPITETKTSYPLSNAQQRVWILSQEAEGSKAYNLPNKIELVGAYDLNIFKKAILTVVKRHEILRTVFSEDSNGNPSQIVLSPKEIGYDIAFKDFSDKPDAEEQADLFCEKDSYLPFDLVTGPLFRACLIKLSNDTYIFYYNMHHIISDGWSMEVLLKDVMQYYEGYISGKSVEVAPLRLQYRDYAAWQIARVSDSVYQKEKEFWQSLLSGNPSNLNLPTKKRRPPQKTFTGKKLGVFISAETTGDLRKFTKSQGGSLFMGLLTVFKVLIYRYTGETDIVVGNPIAGRNHADLENQIGIYINTLALRNEIDPANNFVEIFKQIKDTTLQALEHQMYPFDKLLEDINVRRESTRSPLFDILVNHLGTSNASEFKNETAHIVSLDDVMVLFDVEVDFSEAEGGIDMEVRYNDSIYDFELMKNFMGHFVKLLNELLKTPETIIDKIHYLLDQEETKFLQHYNDTFREYDLNKTIIDHFHDHALANPERIALEFKGESFTYGDLDRESAYLATNLLARSVKTEELIAICMEKGKDMIVAILAVFKSGAAYVPVDPNYPKARMNFILEDSKTTRILTTKSLDHVVESYASTEIIYADSILSELTDEEIIEEIQVNTTPKNLAYVIYTSGSTGKPKGVEIQHESLLNFLCGMQEALNFDQKLSFLSLTTFTFDISLLEFLAPLLLGGKMILIDDVDSKDPDTIIKIIKETKPNCIQGTPSRWQMLFDNGWECIRDVVLLSGGEAIHQALNDLLTEKNDTVWNLYGPTETTIWSCISPLQYEEKVTIGVPMANTQVYILDDNLELVPEGMVGQLCISGLGLAKGYLNRPDLTAQKFIAHPFKENERLYQTGDLARWLPDGRIEFVGRNDQQIKINGYRVELGEIESIINKLDTVQKSIVTVHDAPNTGVQLVAYLLGAAEIDFNSVQDALLAELPDYMVPRLYMQIEEIPLTSNGKIDRKSLPEPVLKQEYVAPQNNVHEKLVKIWQDVLQIEKVGIRDAFFQVGGNSLRAIRVLNAINKEFGLKYDLRGIYVENTIELIAEKIDIDSRFKENVELNESEFSEIRI